MHYEGQFKYNDDIIYFIINDSTNAYFKNGKMSRYINYFALFKNFIAIYFMP